MQHQTTIKPKWATVYDRDIDVSDLWAERFDRENEHGESVTAYLTANGEAEISGSDPYGDVTHATTFKVEGIEVDFGGRKGFYDRERLLHWFGPSWVHVLEEKELEAAAFEETGVVL